MDVKITELDGGRGAKYSIAMDGSTLTFREVIEAWIRDKPFRSAFNQVLADATFTGFRWETPKLTAETVQASFEFVLLDAPSFCKRRTDERSFAQHFIHDDKDHGVVAFANLGGDATLIVPSPRTDASAYGHLAAFVRNAPPEQTDAFWRVVGLTVEKQISSSPVWLSTAGGGVAWLHARIDSYPKYYGYHPYKRDM